MDPLELMLYSAAGFLAGAVNAVAGGGSLIAFLALLGVGTPSLTAKMTTTVAVLPGNLASVAGGYRDLPARREAVRILPAALFGGVAGSLLLLSTSPRTFDRIVPFLVLSASAIFGLQDRLTGWVARAAGRRHGRHPAALYAYVAVGGLYGGYVGAGFGIMLVAGLAFLQRAPLSRTVAAKNLLSAVISLVSVVLFVLFGDVDWRAVAFLFPATVLGGYGGARIVGKLPNRLLRAAIVTSGTAFGLALLWQNFR